MANAVENGRDDGKKRLLEEEGELRRIPNKFLKIGKKEIEREQLALRLFVKKKRLGANLCFHYAGNEYEEMKKTILPFRQGLTMLVLHGSIEVSDHLLDNVAAAFPLLRKLEIEVGESYGNAVRGEGLQRLVDGLKHLQRLAINNCAALQRLSIRSASLEKVAILGLGAMQCRGVHVHAPLLRNLVLGFAASRSGQEGHAPEGLVESVARHKPHLEWLCVQFPLAQTELQQLGLSEMPHLKGLSLHNVRVPDEQVLLQEVLFPVLPQLQTFELSSSLISDFLVRFVAVRAPALKRLVLHGGMLSGFVLLDVFSQLTQLTHFGLTAAQTEEIRITSPSLIGLEIREMPLLTFVDLDTPSLETLVMQVCPNLSKSSVHLKIERDCKLVLPENFV